MSVDYQNACLRLVGTLAISLLCVSCSDSQSGATPTAGQATGNDDQTTTPSTQADWPIFRGNSALRGLAVGTLPDDPQILWTFETGGAIASSPIVVDGRAYVGSDDGFVYCIDITDGSEVWRFETEDIVEAPPFHHAGIVYIGASDFFLYALNAETGELIWKTETDDTILGGANLVALPGEPDRIVVGSYDATLYCFDAKTGEQVWTYVTEDRVNGTPAVIDGLVIFGGCDAALHMVDARTGAGVTRLELGPDCHIAASVGVDGGKVYFGHNANQFVSADLEHMEIDWTYDDTRQGFFTAPAIGDDRVVFGGRDRQIHCVDRATGEGIWTFQTLRKVDGSPIICGDRVVFGSGDGRLYMVDLETGEEVWSYDLGRPIFSSPAIVDGMILIGCGDKRLYAFGKAS